MEYLSPSISKSGSLNNDTYQIQVLFSHLSYTAISPVQSGRFSNDPGHASDAIPSSH
jgi:hypothetical protein